MSDANRQSDVLVEKLLHSGRLNVADLKLLHSAFRDTADEFRQTLNTNAVNGCSPTFGSVASLNPEALPALLARHITITPVNAGDWGSEFYILIDRVSIIAVMESLFGAHDKTVADTGNSPLGALEHKVSQLITSGFVAALNAAFADGGANFIYASHKEVADWPVDQISQQRLYTADFDIAVPAETGRITLLLPRDTQKSMLECLQIRQSTSTDRPDPDWSNRMHKEVSLATIQLEASIPLGTMDLHQLACLKIGQVLELADGATQQIMLSAANKQMFTCLLGKSGSNYSLKINRTVQQDENLINELIADRKHAHEI